MSNANDFVVTVHALDRFQERFPALWTNDKAVGRLIHRETMDAIQAGRLSYVPPVELVSYNVAEWKPGKSLFVWTVNKERGYAIAEDAEGEMTVTTVLVGEAFAKAREKLYGNRSWRYRWENGDQDNQEVPPEAGVEEAPTEVSDERQSPPGADRRGEVRRDQGS